jgi:hypothetical protein
LLGCIKRSRKKFDDDSAANYSIALPRASRTASRCNPAPYRRRFKVPKNNELGNVKKLLWTAPLVGVGLVYLLVVNNGGSQPTAAVAAQIQAQKNRQTYDHPGVIHCDLQPAVWQMPGPSPLRYPLHTLTCSMEIPSQAARVTATRMVTAT